jgi:D-lactate dehydrogenase
MGPSVGDPLDEPLHRVTERVLRRAGFNVTYPEKMNSLCCGLPFESKGFFEQADRKSKELETALLAASENGRLPVLCDTSPCLERMRRSCEIGLSHHSGIFYRSILYLVDQCTRETNTHS